jgi:septal ring factor EnvC (AmiA/AmiB activator)
MYINFLSKSTTQKDKLFWKKQYLEQLTTKLKDTENGIKYRERQIERLKEANKDSKLKIKDQKKHIKEIESMVI